MNGTRRFGLAGALVTLLPMRPRAIIFITVLAFAIGTLQASAAGTWAITKKKTANHSATISTTIHNVRNIAVKFIHGSGIVKMTCRKSIIKTSFNETYRSGLHQLPNTNGADSCHVVASITGRRRVTVQILTQ